MAVITPVTANHWITATTGGANANTCTLTWGATPTTGNILLLVATSTQTFSLPTGWTKLASALDSMETTLWGKIASSEGTTQVVTLTSGSLPIAMAGFEGSGQLAGAIAAVFDASATATVNGSSAAMSTGTTGTTAQADEYAIACWAGNKNAAGTAGQVTWASQTNSYVERCDVTTTATGDKVNICVASLDLHATGTTGSTATPSVDGGGGVVINSGAIAATFKVASTAVANPPPPIVVPSAAVVRASTW